MTASRLLESINSPADLRRLDRKQLPQLATELRAFLIDSVSKTGGHLSSNLGTVELTIALHAVFNTPEDRLVWDVGHQCYAHKVLTGRREGMSTLRMHGGVSGFPSAAKVSTTPLASGTRRPRSPPHSAWHWLPSTRARTARPSPSSAMVPCRPAWPLKP
jgi:deoxyxylulose-5-phosphate synthase